MFPLKVNDMAEQEGLNISPDTPLREIMIRNVLTVQVDEPVSRVDELMKLHPIHHVPVLQGGILKGLISQRDLYRNMLSASYFDNDEEQRSFLDDFTNIADIMTCDPMTLSPNQSLGEALHLMLEYRIGCIPLVSDRNELEGIVSDSDFMRLFWKKLLDGEEKGESKAAM